jgi:hypothetical protein
MKSRRISSRLWRENPTTSRLLFNSLIFNRLLKNAHLPRFPYPSSLRRTLKYAAFLRISGALHLGIFEQPEEWQLFQRPVKE